MNTRLLKLFILLVSLVIGGALFLPNPVEADFRLDPIDRELRRTLRKAGFTGRIEATLEKKLGRSVNQKLAELGRLLWFDTLTGLNDDNSCAGCHSPSAGFGDTQSIAIGIDNNNIVGPDRIGPRNQRRTPMVINSAFFPTLMWNSRFAALSNDPFDNSKGFLFPEPEGMILSHLPTLLAAQAFIPPTERVEVAGFVFPGDNFDIRKEVLRRLNATLAYVDLFGQSFVEVRNGAPITFEMFGKAIAEFEFTLVFANAPIDKYARGNLHAMTADQKAGALLFFGPAGCVECHAVDGDSNEMFSDFKQHVLAVPQIAPKAGDKFGNMKFDGPSENEDFGLEQVTGNPEDRYAFRTSPLRNVALQPTFFHNGAFTDLEDGIRHHLNPYRSARFYDAKKAGVSKDLTHKLGPIEPVLAKLDKKLQNPQFLTRIEMRQLVDFVRNGLLDPRAKPDKLKRLVPDAVPSGRKLHVFQFPK